MITYTELVNSMTEAYRGGASLQSTVRTFIRENIDKPNEEVAGSIATVVTEYRRTVDSWIEEESLFGTELKAAIKKRDNIINDVSRICREMLGHSVVCTSRKKGEYKAIPQMAKTRTPKPVAEAAAGPCTKVHFDPDNHCHIPAGPTELADILEKSKRKWDTGLEKRVVIFKETVSAEDICSVSVNMGVTLEDLAKYILATLKG